MKTEGDTSRQPKGFEAHPLTPERWDDLVELFGRPGSSMVRSCWCMYYRRTGKAEGVYGKRPDANRADLKALVDRDYVPGLVGYVDGRPVGWVSVSPREDYLKLQRSPVMRPVDDMPVWSIVCFFVDSESRGSGITERLLNAAVEYARSRGATLVEGYPVDKGGRSHANSMWFGARAIYDRAGFVEVARRKPNRPVMRKGL